MAVDLMEISKSGLMSSSQLLKTTGHNVSNVNTEGYSRQMARQASSRPVPMGNVVLGSGSYVKSVGRIHNEFIERKINLASSDQAFFAERYKQLSVLDEFFNEINSEGVAQMMNNFFNSFRELSAQPENKSLRSLVRDTAVLMIREFHNKTELLNDSIEDYNRIFTESISDANSLMHNIGQLNVKILELETQNGETGDMRDERDLYLRELSTIMETHTYTDEHGHFIVSSPGIGVLVSAAEVRPFNLGYMPDGEEMKVLYPNSKDVFMEKIQVSDGLKNGKIAAVIKTRKEELVEIKSELNELAFALASIVNSIHEKGYINANAPLDEQGNPIDKEKYTGVSFFKIPKNIFEVAEKIELSDEIKSSSDYISTASNINKPGDNSVALAISKLSHTKILNGSTKTLEEKYLEMVGKLSLSTSKAKMDMEQNEGLLAQFNAIKQRISGVSLDEETSNLIRFQHAYDASARVMRAAQETMDTVLNIKK